MSLDRKAALERLKRFDFPRLFTQELGWDRAAGIKSISVRDQTFALEAVAEKRGVQVFVCPPADNGQIPPSDIRAAVDREITKHAYEHLLIFADVAQTEQLWLYPRRDTGKPVRLIPYRFDPHTSNEALLQKLSAITFTLNEEEELTLLGVTQRLRETLDRDKLTKSFYQRFAKERETFQKFLEGIPDAKLKHWYVAVLMNRLMFIYFIQEKGFLDARQRYLQDRLQGFNGNYYHDFLCPLFLGLALPEADRPPATKKMLGRIPYLNSSIFQKYEIEELHGGTIEIPNKAFVALFAFFDDYRWHLDERPLSAGNEINPDVLSYIFEKYINQKQMGAYYTKEDITEYISKNTVLPFLFDAARAKCKVAFENPKGPTVWDLLSDNPDRYIYPAVRHGASEPLPEKIAAGLNPPTLHQPVGDGPVQTLELRQGWNKVAPQAHALRTETWREVIARRKRYEEIRARLAAGEVRDINDLITLNLDIRQFAQDVIENCEGPELLRAFWHTIEKVTILDPTCGSGAFLFAALNILEPLYEACLTRMEAFVADLDHSGEKHSPVKFSDFRKVLTNAAAHPNRRYFIFKSIILKNLYGVDIMEEAVEICKLRLFLKLAAQVEPDLASDNLGIEPLPDIDFNIRAGNTLVGYATYDEVERVASGDFGTGKSGMFDFDSTMEKISTDAADLQQVFDEFRARQVEGDGSVPAEDKQELLKRLNALDNELNRYLAGEYDVEPSKKDAYTKWLKSHQPFHWFIEFYRIMNEGGFDVIIGNPPYTEIPKQLGRQMLCNSFKTALERWSRDEDLYTLVVERSLRLLRAGSAQFGMILPLSLAFSTKRPFCILRKILGVDRGCWHWSHFDRIPSALFGNEVRTRCTIALLSRMSGKMFHDATTPLRRWNTDYREVLFDTLTYAELDVDIASGIPKVSSQIQADVLKGLLARKSPLAPDLARSIPFNELADAAPRFPQPCVYIGGTAYNWFPAWRDIPETTTVNGRPSLPARTAGYKFTTEEQANVVFALLCSSLGYWWWAVASDAFNLKKWLLERFPLSINMIPSDARKELSALGAALRKELKRNYVFKNNKGRIGNFFLPACEREVVAIDTFLASSLPGLSLEFFEDVRGFNACFSRAEVSDAEAEDDE
ncbi:MAG: SAM-dependent methyltransferase [Armatimonadetes bacterium CG_4_10_14_3_um_filter_59_10]|nr:MAG: SAM-dependent methyltransferase [Armatimonadetes bacterium CG_4_10_14_3_um_filter_59_10]